MNATAPGATSASFDTAYEFGGATTTPRLVADLDADGKLDVIDTFYLTLAVFQNVTADGELQLAPKGLRMDTGSVAAVLPDRNGDGRPELVMALGDASSALALLLSGSHCD